MQSMFEKKTVFIIGAGASWHYGYPTGAELVESIIESALKIRAYLYEIRGSQIRRWQDYRPKASEPTLK